MGIGDAIYGVSFSPVLVYQRVSSDNDDQTTPAWREVYGSILDQLLQRYRTYWGNIDWQTMLGHDPQHGTYPEAWIRLYIPADRVGHYDVPGWTANSIEPWGLQMDPIGADGNLFYKGFSICCWDCTAT